ncbi:hypothetical protein DOM21_14395 [Bacteriovorax stolpii]|uniref:hypothetical protein n=1 Tax=Bacteriovorax stolpii TaxID=960 RepID=UPI00115A2C23|nr:hypothetical protein [Bacteriovorax stolpii]QDK42618.1 hypothetical protein DOM21_14395 [Bacteriovorax stolpii]
MKELNRFDRYALKYFVYSSPIFIGFMIWASMEFKGASEPANLKGGVWDIFGWCFIAWVLILLYTVTKMLFGKKFRDTTMAKLAGIKERDEREGLVAGNAAKFSFLSTFALLLFMLVFSVTTLTVKKNEVPAPGKNGQVAIGFGLKAHDETAFVHQVKDGVESFDYKSIPLSKPFMLLVIMIWQIGSYHLVARRELRE